ncbi:MAG: response regulator [Candidatus Doudnabacteria bacterium]|nr:response regulator [Candidatus Doudnabacteria bacterium]
MNDEPKRILVVEDEGAMRDIVTHKLQSHGFLVTQAVDGKDGLEAFNRDKPDMVLLDLMLPEVDGFTVLETIRKNSDEKLANTPVIILSNIWNDKDIVRVRGLKISDYMVKAYFTTDEILNRVNAILGI